MIDGPGSSKPNLSVPPNAKSEDSVETGSSTPSQSTQQSVQAPLGKTSDTFTTSPATLTLPKLETPEQPLPSKELGKGRPTGPRQSVSNNPTLSNAERVAVLGGEDWAAVIQRHYGVELSPALVSQIAKANGQTSDMRPQKLVAMPTLKDLYFELHPAEREASRKIIQRARFVSVSPGQSMEEVIKQHYSIKNPRALDALAGAALFLNDSTRYGATPSVIALPSLRDLGGLLGRMRTEVKAVEDRRGTTDEVAILPPMRPTPGRKLRDILTTDKKALYTVPVAGGRYQTEWNDNLGDLSIYVYREALLEEGLPADEAEERLQEIMAVVARINDLTTVDVGASREMYLPTMKEIEGFLSDRRARQETDRFKSPKNQVWNEILEVSQGAQFRAKAIETLVVGTSAPDSTSRMDGIETASHVVSDMRLEEAHNKRTAIGLPHLGSIYSVLMDVYDDSRKVSPGDLKFRRADESFGDYAQRLFNDTLKPRELEMFKAHPEMLLAIHMKIMNRNTKWEPGQRDALESGLRKLGLMDEAGHVNFEDCETPAAVDKKTAESFLAATGLDEPFIDGESIDVFFGRVSRAPLTDAQRESLRVLVFFNVMAKKSLSELEKNGGHPSSMDHHHLDLDDVEASMGVRSEEFYGNSGSALSDHERAVLGAILLGAQSSEEPTTAQESSGEDDTRRANAFRARFFFELKKEWQEPVVFSDEQDKLFRQASLRMMEDMLDDVEAYEQKIQEGVRQVAQLLMSGQPLGAPASWFG